MLIEQLEAEFGLPPLYPEERRAVQPSDEQLELLAELDAVAVEQAERGLPKRARPHELLPTSWNPWWAQRMVLRDYVLGIAMVFVIVAGRQSGKTEVAVQLLLTVALERPGSYSMLIAPNYLIAQTVIDKLLTRSQEIPGMVWKRGERRFYLGNGSIVQLFSADRPDKVGRGPQLTGMLWTEEAAFLSVRARDAALGSLSAAQNPLKCFTTTPKGKNWVFTEFTTPPSDGEKKATYRFKSEHSPFANLAEIARNRRRMGKDMAAQEYDAEFVDSILLVFDDPASLFVEKLPERTGLLGNVIGMDVAKHQDWAVFTLLNKWAEGRIVDRFQKPKRRRAAGKKKGKKAKDTYYADLFDRAKRTLDHYNAAACIDTENNSGAGEALADFLEAAGYRVIRVPTGQPRKKAKLVERAQAAYERGEIKLLKNEHYDQAIVEFQDFLGLSRAIDGKQVNWYGCPEEEGKHDDIPISVCLAYWGITEQDVLPDYLSGDHSGFGVDLVALARGGGGGPAGAIWDVPAGFEMGGEIDLGWGA